MKKTMSLFCIILLLMSMHTIVNASAISQDYTQLFNSLDSVKEEPLEQYTFGESVVCVPNVLILNPEKSYINILESGIYRTAVLLKDGMPVGRANFAVQDGMWVCTSFMEDGPGLADLIQKYGNDIILFSRIGSDHVLLTDENNLVYRYDEVTAEGESALQKVSMPNVINLEDYLICIAYQNVQEQNGNSYLMGDGSVVFDETYLHQAKEYWAESKDFAWMIPVIIVGVTALGVVIFAVSKAREALKRR